MEYIYIYTYNIYELITLKIFILKDPKLIDKKRNNKPRHILSTKDNQLVFVETSKQLKAKNNHSIPLSVNLIELREKANYKSSGDNHNQNINNEDKNKRNLIIENSDEHNLGIDREQLSNRLTGNFVQITSQVTGPNKGKRFLFVMIILICVVAAILVLIKFSLEWATSSRTELNKLNDLSKKTFLDIIKNKNESIGRLEMNL